MTDKSEQLLQSFSEHHIFVDQKHLDQYRYNDKMPIAAVEADSVYDIKQLLSECNTLKSSVNIVGAGNHQELGGPLQNVDIALSVKGLERPFEPEPENLSVTVGAGMRFDDLQSRLTEFGLFLPINPPISGATLGGLVSVNAFGDWMHGFGTFRDWILGGRAILADGMDIRFGGKTVKNVAGYDMAKLFIGAMGTLGVLTELTFKLYPVPEKIVHLQWQSLGLSALQDIVQVINKHDLPVISFASEHEGPVHAKLNLSLHCREQETSIYIEKLSELLPVNLSPDIQHWQQWLQKPAPKVLDAMVEPNSMVMKWVFPLSVYNHVLNYVYSLQESNQLSCYGFPGRGILYTVSHDEQTIAQMIEKLAPCRQFINGHDGILTIVKSPIKFKDKSFWDISDSELSWHKKIKKEFDAAGVFASGRFVGGI